MTKADLAEKIHTNTGLSRKDSAAMMESVFELIKVSLEAGEDIKISGFGSFTVSQKAARRVLAFKPSTLLRQTVNRGQA